MPNFPQYDNNRKSELEYSPRTAHKPSSSVVVSHAQELAQEVNKWKRDYMSGAENACCQRKIYIYVGERR